MEVGTSHKEKVENMENAPLKSRERHRTCTKKIPKDFPLEENVDSF